MTKRERLDRILAGDRTRGLSLQEQAVLIEAAALGMPVLDAVIRPSYSMGTGSPDPAMWCCICCEADGHTPDCPVKACVDAGLSK